MFAKTIMIQGTGSHVGKSVLVAALCRIFAEDGYSVAPFKAQNMALNSGVTPKGEEIGRAQIVQAEAAGTEPTVYMNPILLKPSAPHLAQVIVKGKPFSNMSAKEYHRKKRGLFPIIADAFETLRAQFEIIVIEGAGSPAEINLKEEDIANMKVAELAHAPVVLVGDIDRGGVFAWLIGTWQLLSSEERRKVQGFVINRFRGDVSLLKEGISFLERKTNVPVFGVIPYWREIKIEEEDSLSLSEGKERNLDEPAELLEPDKGSKVNVAVISLPHLSNFTDFNSLETEPGVRVEYISSSEELNQPDLLILPGSKNTISDLRYLKKTKIDKEILRLAKNKTPIIGVCGGFQMLGERIIDSEGIESDQKQIEGLGLLNVETEFSSEKDTTRAEGKVLGNGDGFLSRLEGAGVKGYEIHMGETYRKGDTKPALQLFREQGEVVVDGAASKLIFGTYLHGLFDSDEFRKSLIGLLRKKKGLKPLARGLDFEEFRKKQFDKLAELVRNSVDIPSLYRIMKL